MGLGQGKASLGVNLGDAGILQSSFASKMGRLLLAQPVRQIPGACPGREPHVLIGFTAPAGRCHPLVGSHCISSIESRNSVLPHLPRTMWKSYHPGKGDA